MPQISIIIPIYNVESFLKKCLDSVITQKFEDIEIICIDDGSTDNSYSILNEYKDRRIRIIRQENKGLSAARNAGLDIASGEYFLFLDPDDWFEKNTCERLLKKAFKEKDADIIFFNFRFHLGNQTRIYNISETSDLPAQNTLNFDSCQKDIMKLDFVVWNKMYKSDFIKKNNIRFENSLEMSEDRVFGIDAFIKNPKISLLNEVLYNYQIRQDSKSHKDYKFALFNMIQAYKCLENKEYFVSLDENMKISIMDVFLRDLLFWRRSAKSAKNVKICKKYTDIFLKMIKKYRKIGLNELETYKKLRELSIKDISKNVAILCFASDNTNFGANLVPYAMTRIVERLGFKPAVINLNTNTTIQDYKYPHQVSEMVNFRERFIPLTSRIFKPSQFYDLNKDFSIFIVGSDQVWNTVNTKEFTLQYFLDFAKSNKGLIAYATSFGMETFVGSKKTVNIVNKLLKRFDFISLREKSGENVLHNTFGHDIKCSQTIDPTLLLSAEDYQEIIDVELCKNPVNYIAYYMLSNDYLNQEVENTARMNKISDELSMPLIDISKTNFEGEGVLKYSSVGQWLNYIKNSSLFITDSFHGVCFSIIYRKNFFYINKLGATRVKNLLTLLNLEDRIYNSFDDIDISNICNSNINYGQSENILADLKKKSLKFLENSLDCVKNPDYIKTKKKDKIIFFQKIKLYMADFSKRRFY